MLLLFYTLKLSRVKARDSLSCDEKSQDFLCESRQKSWDYGRENRKKIQALSCNWEFFHVSLPPPPPPSTTSSPPPQKKKIVWQHTIFCVMHTSKI